MQRLAFMTAPALALALVGQAGAQTVNSGVGIAPSRDVAAPAAPAPKPDVEPAAVEHLFGDWFGARPVLDRQGINLQLDFITEFAGNVSGGTRRGATFANQLGFQADVDWERLAGLTGLSTHVILVNRSGSSVSHLFGDNFLPAQEIYGAGGNVGVHLVSAYAQETLFDRRLDLAAGRMNVENDFASSPLYCTFMNNGLCGDPKALPGGDIGHSAFPDATWAARVRVRPTPELYVQSGAYEVNQGLYTNRSFRTGFEFDTSEDSGVYVPVELGWEPRLGPDELPGHYKLGFGYDSSNTYKDFGAPLAAAGVPGFLATTHTGNTQVWVLADQMLVRYGAGDNEGLIALAGFVGNDPNNSAYAEQYLAALIDRGFWAERPKDALGLLVTYNTVSGRLGSVQGLQQALGLPLSNGATGRQSSEVVLELNYDIHVARGIDVQPDVQYVFRPNAQANIPDAAVLGFRAHVSF